MAKPLWMIQTYWKNLSILDMVRIKVEVGKGKVMFSLGSHNMFEHPHIRAYVSPTELFWVPCT